MSDGWKQSILTYGLMQFKWQLAKQPPRCYQVLYLYFCLLPLPAVLPQMLEASCHMLLNKELKLHTMFLLFSMNYPTTVCHYQHLFCGGSSSLDRSHHHSLWLYHLCPELCSKSCESHQCQFNLFSSTNLYCSLCMGTLWQNAGTHGIPWRCPDLLAGSAI